MSVAIPAALLRRNASDMRHAKPRRITQSSPLVRRQPTRLVVALTGVVFLVICLAATDATLLDVCDASGASATCKGRCEAARDLCEDDAGCARSASTTSVVPEYDSRDLFVDFVDACCNNCERDAVARKLALTETLGTTCYDTCSSAISDCAADLQCFITIQKLLPRSRSGLASLLAVSDETSKLLIQEVLECIGGCDLGCPLSAAVASSPCFSATCAELSFAATTLDPTCCDSAFEFCSSFPGAQGCCDGTFFPSRCGQSDPDTCRQYLFGNCTSDPTSTGCQSTCESAELRCNADADCWMMTSSSREYQYVSNSFESLQLAATRYTSCCGDCQNSPDARRELLQTQADAEGQQCMDMCSAEVEACLSNDICYFSLALMDLNSAGKTDVRLYSTTDSEVNDLVFDVLRCAISRCPQDCEPLSQCTIGSDPCSSATSKAECEDVTYVDDKLTSFGCVWSNDLNACLASKHSCDSLDADSCSDRSDCDLQYVCSEAPPSPVSCAECNQTLEDCASLPACETAWQCALSKLGTHCEVNDDFSYGCIDSCISTLSVSEMTSFNASLHCVLHCPGLVGDCHCDGVQLGEGEFRLSSCPQAKTWGGSNPTVTCSAASSINGLEGILVVKDDFSMYVEVDRAAANALYEAHWYPQGRPQDALLLGLVATSATGNALYGGALVHAASPKELDTSNGVSAPATAPTQALAEPGHVLLYARGVFRAHTVEDKWCYLTDTMEGDFSSAPFCDGGEDGKFLLPAVVDLKDVAAVTCDASFCGDRGSDNTCDAFSDATSCQDADACSWGQCAPLNDRCSGLTDEAACTGKSWYDLKLSRTFSCMWDTRFITYSGGLCVADTHPCYDIGSRSSCSASACEWQTGCLPSRDCEASCRPETAACTLDSGCSAALDCAKTQLQSSCFADGPGDWTCLSFCAANLNRISFLLFTRAASCLLPCNRFPFLASAPCVDSTQFCTISEDGVCGSELLTELYSPAVIDGNVNEAIDWLDHVAILARDLTADDAGAVCAIGRQGQQLVVDLSQLVQSFQMRITFFSDNDVPHATLGFLAASGESMEAGCSSSISASCLLIIKQDGKVATRANNAVSVEKGTAYTLHVDVFAEQVQVSLRLSDVSNKLLSQLSVSLRDFKGPWAHAGFTIGHGETLTSSTCFSLLSLRQDFGCDGYCHSQTTVSRCNSRRGCKWSSLSSSCMVDEACPFQPIVGTPCANPVCASLFDELESEPSSECCLAMDEYCSSAIASTGTTKDPACECDALSRLCPDFVFSSTCRSQPPPPPAPPLDCPFTLDPQDSPCASSVCQDVDNWRDVRRLSCCATAAAYCDEHPEDEGCACGFYDRTGCPARPGVCAIGDSFQAFCSNADFSSTIFFDRSFSRFIRGSYTMAAQQFAARVNDSIIGNGISPSAIECIFIGEADGDSIRADLEVTTQFEAQRVDTIVQEGLISFSFGGQSFDGSHSAPQTGGSGGGDNDILYIMVGVAAGMIVVFVVFMAKRKRDDDYSKRDALEMGDLDGERTDHDYMETKLVDGIYAVDKLSPSLLDEFGFAPIHYAIIEGDTARLDDILKRNRKADTYLAVAAATSPSSLPHTPESMGSAATGSSTITSTLSSSYSKGVTPISAPDIVNLPDVVGYTPLMLAVLCNNEDAVRKLLAAGANVNSQNDSGLSPLHLACATSSSVSLAVVLLVAKADVKAQDAEGSTPLHHAVLTNNPDMVELLVNREADVCSQDHAGMTPLTLAIAQGCGAAFETLMQLISHRINCTTIINTGDKRGNTPLHWAALVNDGPMCSALLEQGARVAQQNLKGETPVHSAVKEDNETALAALLKLDCPDLIPVLTRNTNSNESVLDMARQREHWGCLQKLLQAGEQCDIDWGVDHDELATLRSLVALNYVPQDDDPMPMVDASTLEGIGSYVTMVDESLGQFARDTSVDSGVATTAEENDSDRSSSPSKGEDRPKRQRKRVWTEEEREKNRAACKMRRERRKAKEAALRTKVEELQREAAATQGIIDKLNADKAKLLALSRQ